MKKSHVFARIIGIYFTLISLSTLAQDTKKRQRYDSLLSQHLISETPGGVVLMSRKGNILYETAFGMANLELNEPMNIDHIFRVGSITKQFTSVAILKLVQEEKLLLDDSLGQFFQDFPATSRSVTVRQLLNHTSGIRNITELPAWDTMQGKDLDVDELIDTSIQEPFYFEPGSDFHYSNSNYHLLGKIIEIVSGETYAEYIQHHIFKPLSMRTAYYDYSERVIPRRISGYLRNGDVYENCPYINMNLPFAAGGLMMSIRDYRQWHQALQQERIIPRDKLMSAQVATVLDNNRKIGYGYGWSIGELQGYKTVKHSGYINGFSVFELYLPEKEALVVLFANCSNLWNLEFVSSLLMAEAIEQPFEQQSIEPNLKVMKSFIGKYESTAKTQRKIILQRDQLFICQPGGSKMQMIPTSNRKFQLANSLTGLEFSKSKKRRSFQLRDLGLPQEFTRVDSDDIFVLNNEILPDSILHEYVGSYQFEGGPAFEIIYEEGKMYGAVGSDRKEITPYAEDKFYAKDIDAQLIFSRNKEDEITSFMKIQNGEMKAVRIE